MKIEHVFGDFINYVEVLEYISGTKAGIIRPYSLDELKEKDHDWVLNLWDAFEVIQGIEQEKMSDSMNTPGQATRMKPMQQETMTMDEQLASLSRAGM